MFPYWVLFMDDGPASHGGGGGEWVLLGFGVAFMLLLGVCVALQVPFCRVSGKVDTEPRRDADDAKLQHAIENPPKVVTRRLLGHEWTERVL